MTATVPLSKETDFVEFMLRVDAGETSPPAKPGEDELVRRMVEVAVAAAPALTSQQITDLRRVFKPGVRIPTVTQLPTREAAPKPARRAA